MDIHKICSICKIEKYSNDFYSSQRSNKCKECILKITREYKKNKRKDIEFKKIESQKQKERRVRLWMNTLLHDSKYRNKINTLTISDIKEIYERQKGLCFWFKVPLIPSQNKKHPQQPSLDRIDRNKGYTKENVVITCYSANISRNENDIETWTKFLDLIIK